MFSFTSHVKKTQMQSYRNLRSMSTKHLHICWTNNAILGIMKPIRDIVRYTTHMRKLVIIVTIMSVLGALIQLLIPLGMKFATDWVIAIVGGKAQFSTQGMIGFFLLFLGLGLVNVAVTDIGGWFGDMLAIRTRRQLSRHYYAHLLALPQKYYDGEVTGKIINRLSRAITDITQFLQFFSNNLLKMLLTMAITVVVLAVYSWQLAVLFILLIPANLYLTAKTSDKWQKLENKKNTHFDIASGRFAEVIGQIRLAKSFGSQQRELSSFDGRMTKMVALTRRQSTHWHKMNALRGIVFGTVNAAILCVLFWQTAQKHLTVGEMVMLLTLVQQAALPMLSLSFFVDSYQRAVANSKDYIKAMSEAPEPEDASQKLHVTKAEIVFDKVDFAYEQKKQVLHAISFTVRPGEKVALVGESGGGKSTIANLLMRLYEPDNGTIQIDGTPLGKVSRASVRGAIATVFQDAALFSGTIRENIAYARPDADDHEIKAAAHAANALKFIDQFPDGLDTEIGERGIKLSGGQKQRIAIARAILKDAPILILDEATSSLDSRSEHEVQQALDRLMKGRTTLIIAHRLSTIAGVDTIVTLRDGHIDEVGGPAKLAHTNGIYAQLLRLQLGATEAAKKQLAKYDIAS